VRACVRLSNCEKEKLEQKAKPMVTFEEHSCEREKKRKQIEQRYYAMI